MNTLPSEPRPARAIDVKVTKDELAVFLDDGRSVTVPIGWYPRLSHGTAKERGNWQIISRGEGIHWQDLDEDISVEGLLAGYASGESQQSFQKWLASRKNEGSDKALRRTSTPSRARKARRTHERSRG